MNAKPLTLIVTACLLLFLTALYPGLATAQTAAQLAISEKARENGMGRPREESPEARQTPAPRNEGWWQAFERGWVYWHPTYGAQIVHGTIFDTWAAQRWEQGPLGFPRSGEFRCRVPDSRDRYQVFEGGRIYWHAATNEATVFNNPTNFGEGGNCDTTPPPDETEIIFSSRYTSAGTSGDQTFAIPATGELWLDNFVRLARSTQSIAFISQALPVERGVRRVRVSATLDVSYSLSGLSLLAGYSSAEAIVNLRVMDGSRVDCSERISVARLITAVVGVWAASGRRPITLQCEFTRPAPDTATTYALIAEIEGWAGAGGISNAGVDETARVRQFHVYLNRR